MKAYLLTREWSPKSDRVCINVRVAAPDAPCTLSRNETLLAWEWNDWDEAVQAPIADMGCSPAPILKTVLAKGAANG